MGPLRYSINVTLDGCCDHRAVIPDEELHRHATENLAQADALLFGRVTYEMMEAAFRPPVRTGARPDWMEPSSALLQAHVSDSAQRLPVSRFGGRPSLAHPAQLSAVRVSRVLGIFHVWPSFGLQPLPYYFSM